jgi:hypothetical protein
LTYDKAEDLHLGISMTVPGHEPLEYSLRLKPQGVSYVISEQELSQQRPGQRLPSLHIDSHGPDVKYFVSFRQGCVCRTWSVMSSCQEMPRIAIEIKVAINL